MKKSLLFVLVTILAAGAVSAQENDPKKRYLNLSYVNSTWGSDYSLESDWGAALTVGRTFRLHKTPIANMVRIGLDWSYIDLNYTTILNLDNCFFSELGMQIGPSVTFSPPVKGLHANAYIRATPSYSVYYNDYVEEVSGSFVPFIVVGTAISYKFISTGIEGRWGEGKYKTFDSDSEYNNKFNINTSGARVYISFRF